MDWPVIRKRVAAANLGDYDAVCRNFSWEAARAELDGLPDGRLNIAYEALDRHVAKGRSGKLAIRWLGKNGETRDFTYADLSAATNRFANVLAQAGIKKGDRVYSLAGRVPELYIAALGTLKLGAVFSPLYSVFGPEPIRTRVERGECKALVTTTQLYQKKIAPWRSEVPGLEHVFLIDGDPKTFHPAPSI